MRLLTLGLGLIMAGAVLHPALAAQVRDTIPRRRDSTLIVVPVPVGADSILRDTLAKQGPPRTVMDTIQPPLAHSESPHTIAIVHPLFWSRDSLFATGALTVADLLDRATGTTTYRAGWLSAPQNATHIGDYRSVRVFLDGMEVRSLDPRAGGILDLGQVNLWAMEDATIEQTADETRVYLRSWRVQGTTPITRTDVGTGDQQTNLYRGFFGRRFGNGAGFQFGAQQYGTTPPSSLGRSSDQLGLMGRVGWANRLVSLDAFASRTSRHRGTIFGSLVVDSIPTVESARTDAYVRVGAGDPDGSLFWGQVMASASKYDYTGVRTFINQPKTPAESLLAFTSLDTSVYRSQYIASAGSNLGPLRASGTMRLYGGNGKTYVVPSARLGFSALHTMVSAYAEAPGPDSSARVDVTARFSPLPFVTFLGSAGQASNRRFADSTFSTRYLRGEAGLRLFNLWFIGGAVRRDSALLAPPIEYDTLFVARAEGPANGATAAIRGQLWRMFHVDLSAIRWSDSTGLYRPQYQTRSELFVKTNLLERFRAGTLDCSFRRCTSTGRGHIFRSGGRQPSRSPGIARFRPCSRFASSPPQSPGSSVISSANATPRFRSSSRRARRTSTACDGSS